MTWFKVDDSFYDHPKVFDAPDCAVALWTRAGSWSARNLTDGFVPANLPARFCDDPDTAVRELCTRGLWIKARGGYRFHDWQDYQPSKEAVDNLRTKRAEAGRLGGLARARRQKRSAGDNFSSSPQIFGPVDNLQAERPGTDESAGQPTEPKQVPSNSQASAKHVGKQNATPARPVPTSGYVGQGRSPTAPARARPPTRCPKHQDHPDPPPCGACGDNRRAAQTWDQQQTAYREHLSHQLERARGDPRMRCEHGTDAGRYLHPDTGQSATCAHCRAAQQALGKPP